MHDILRQIYEGAIGASPLEQAATILGIVGVWLAMREKVLNFPVGLVQVAIFGWVCFEGKLYSETVLQVLFFVALCYGWWHWTRGSRDTGPLLVQRLSRGTAIAWSLATLVLWSVWGTLMHRFTDAALPYWDGFVFASSVISQWLQARKALENWIGWIVANTVAVGVFWAKEYYWFSVLYLIFWFMAWGGLRTWLQSWRRSHA